MSGLKPRLYNHQRRSLVWMQGLESSQGTFYNPFEVELTDSDGLVWSVNLVSADTYLRPRVQLGRLSKGGLLCDEPGLGKTVTMMALILHTAGVENAPKGKSYADLLAALTTNHGHWKALSRSQQALEVFSILDELDKTHEKGIVHAFGAEYHCVMKHRVEVTARNKQVDVFVGMDMTVEFFFLEDLYKAIEALVDSFAGHETLRFSFFELCKRLNATSKRASPMRKNKRIKGFIRSGCTLVVVPGPLLKHWKDQIALHMDKRVLKSHGGAYVGDKLDLSVEELAKKLIVVTTINRISAEASKTNSLLKQICFLRCIVDEGHSLGGVAETNYSNFLNEGIEAERLWVMTGTPTKETSLVEGMSALGKLLRFLKVAPFHTHGDHFKVISQPFLRKHVFGYHVLLATMQQIILRHTKEDILDQLPELTRDVTYLDMTSNEKHSYNAIVSFIKANLVLTSMGDKSKGWDASLLNQANAKHARDVVTNLRISSCGGGRMRLTLSNEMIRETKIWLYKHQATPETCQVVDAFISRAATHNQPSQCEKCLLFQPFLFVSFCGHLVCTECFDAQDLHCRVCQAEIVPESFAYLQPGFQLQWEDREGVFDSVDR